MVLGIEHSPAPARRFASALRVDPDRMIDLYPVGATLDHVVRRRDDVLRRPEVFDQVSDRSFVFRLKPPDELDVGTLEAVDVLVVIAATGGDMSLIRVTLCNADSKDDLPMSSPA